MKPVNALATMAVRAFGTSEAPPFDAATSHDGQGRRVDRADMERLLMDELSGLPPLPS